MRVVAKKPGRIERISFSISAFETTPSSFVSPLQYATYGINPSRRNLPTAPFVPIFRLLHEIVIMAPPKMTIISHMAKTLKIDTSRK
jgi:hypothetical protein